MYYALVYYLPLKVPNLDAFRARHDPRVDVALPHLTLVFPLQGPLDESALKEHIGRVTTTWPTVEVRFHGVMLSWDAFVFLLVEEGREEVIKLHDALYTGILSPFLRHDLPYEPHITLGCSVTDETVREAEQLSFNFLTRLDKLHLIRRGHEYAEAETVEVFSLGPR